MGHFYAFYNVFLRARYRMGKFWGLLKFQAFLGLLEILDIGGGRRVDAGPEPTYGEK